MRIITVLLFVFSLFAAGTVEAEQVVTLEDHVLVVRGEDGAVQMRVPGVPSGLSVHDAFKLATGRLDEMLVPSSKMYSSLKLPFFTSGDEHADKIVTYSKDKDWATLAIIRKTEEKSPAISFILLWFPVLVIASVSFAYVLNGWSYKNLILLHALTFAGIITAGIMTEWSLAALIVGPVAYLFGATVITCDATTDSDDRDPLYSGVAYWEQYPILCQRFSRYHKIMETCISTATFSSPVKSFASALHSS